MSTDLIRYDLLVQEALRSVVRKVLTDTARDGVPGEHHYLVSFRTTAPGVRISNRLREKYPEEMTIVLQHQFWDLGVTDHTFEVGLAFGGVPERLLIPFEAVTGFVDPSVQFGLKFEVAEGSEDDAEKALENDEGHDASVTTLKPGPAALPALRALPSSTATALKPAKSIKPKREASTAAGFAKPADTGDGRGKTSDAKSSDHASSVSGGGDQTPEGVKPSSDGADPRAGAEVVSLDSFRKKN